MARKQHREAFVTIGATAPFLSLLNRALSQDFLKALVSLSYTHLTLQCGSSLKEVQNALEPRKSELKNLGLEVEVFDFTNDMKGYMGVCKGTSAPKGGRRGRVVRANGVEVPSDRADGVVITHAGESTSF